MMVGPGHRSADTLLRLDERDRYLREAASRFCIGMSDRQASEFLRMKLTRYRSGAWRRHQAENLMPPKLAGRIEASCWRILKCRDAIPGDRLVRDVLASRRQTPPYSLPTV
jgi:hypothetical protein